MIISHKYKYIFIKTSKTAGTSTETFFEQLSFSKNVQKEVTHSRSELIHKEGIIGYRGANSESNKQPTWRNHMSLPTIRKLLNNDEIFNQYFKFSNSRNPWDRVVSGYHHLSYIGSKISFNEYVASCSLAPLTSFFEDYINDVYFIRFENLKQDVEYVCKKLGFDFNINNFPTYNTQCRRKFKHKHYTEYYDVETRKIIEKKYAKDIEYFGYKFGE